MVGIGDEQDNVIVVEHEVPPEPRSVNISLYTFTTYCGK